MAGVLRRRKLVALVALILLAPAALHAQSAPGRRGGGVRVGAWNVDVAPWVTRSPQLEAYIQRDLDRDLALENSVGVWRAVVNETRAYIVPLLASLKYYPMTEPDQRIEPFLLGGVGFAFGIQDETDNAVGGGAATIVSGIAFRGAVGVELRVLRGFGVAASGKYQWVHFGEDVGTMETFGGVGFEGALTYRFAL